MCTALSFTTKDHYFGRNLDLEMSFGEQVVVTPRAFPLPYRCLPTQDTHFALIGMATVVDGYPLYYEAANEHGLGMAGLNFPDYCKYYPKVEDRDNVTPFEFIPWVLGQCRSVAEARDLLARTSLVEINFSAQFPLTPEHWMIADHDETIVVESTAAGLTVYDDPVHVMTNSPTFDKQLFMLNNYRSLATVPREGSFGVELAEYSRGMTTRGLPGGLDSASRFAKVAFTRMNAVCGDSEGESVSQFFQILNSVNQQRGLVEVEPGSGKYEITIYSSCINTTTGVYYYTTYGNHQITGVDMHHCDLDGAALSCFPLVEGEQINMLN